MLEPYRYAVWVYWLPPWLVVPIALIGGLVAAVWVGACEAVEWYGEHVGTVREYWREAHAPETEVE